ncbi:hypothetical protein [Acinetobacter bereziniae]|uniref:hypothetical protein n=1 Tax=Acinetobacter bereziniae TaxID=106648 RepID=UPI001115C036|nr:hypothetical protein [Acinetobacter bereziniae]TNL51217.1 hypothetical protein EYB59_08835 [Acinetobacter bereziniae]TNL58462.1 hypothetical protein EYY58_11665 [Acinetobacter bereziniae]
MRDYAKISPNFWAGTTGKELRKCPESLIVSMYLISCPHANMLGLFYVPLLYIAHETGLGFEGASKGLRWAENAGFCSYDQDTEIVWVHEMARFQIADQLKPSDKRSIGAQNEYNSLPSNPYLASFYDKYSKAFCMTQKRDNYSKIASPLQAPSKPLASQEQEQEQEQEKEQEQKQEQEQSVNAENSLEQVLKVWVPDVDQLNDWLKRSGLMPMTPELINQILLEVNSYYQTRLEAGTLEPRAMYMNFVKWVKRDPRLYQQGSDDQQIKEEDLTPPPEIKPIPVKYGQGFGGGK